MKTKWKNLICAGLLSSALMFYGNAEAGVVTNRLPLQCYADHQVNTYNTPGAAKRAGYISANVDLIRITQVRGDGWCYGSYPGAGGKRVARWFRITDVCADAGYTNRSANVRGKQVVYRTRSGGATIGSVSNNEGVIVVADNGSRAQIVYRLDNGTGYKLGWVPSSAVAPAANPVPQGHNPQGYFDAISSPAANQIKVVGWAADRDNMSASLRVHVYVGGGAGSGAESYEIVANKSRTDVRSFFNQQGIAAGEFYGFNDVINVKRTGRQEVYVYAINVGGGNSVELGHKSVDIKARVNPTPQTVTQNTAPYKSILRYPLNNIYVCGNNWMTKYSKRPSRPYHAGIDVKSSSGDKTVYAVADGVVAASGWNNANGNFVVIKHTIGGRQVYSFYCHMSKRMVSKGNTVKYSTPIGIIGNTGSSSTGEHLHFTFVDKLMASGGYWGYVTTKGNAVTYGGYTFYSPAFVIDNKKLP